jgi:hypothetical protein
MAKQSRTDELFEMLRAGGLRKQVAQALTDAASAGRSGAASSQKAAQQIIDDLRKLADDIEARITGKSSTRASAGKKAAQTRASNARKRSATAKKAAATRKRTASSSGGTRKAATTARKAASTTRKAASSATRKATTTRKSSGGSTRRRSTTSRAKKS